MADGTAFAFQRHVEGVENNRSADHGSCRDVLHKNGLPWEDDPETKGIDPYAYNAEAGTANLHLYKEPRFYASVGYDRGTYEVDGKEIILYLRGDELHGSTLKETDEYQSCTGYLCQNGFPKPRPIMPQAIHSAITIMHILICGCRNFI